MRPPPCRNSDQQGNDADKKDIVTARSNLLAQYQGTSETSIDADVQCQSDARTKRWRNETRARGEVPAISFAIGSIRDENQ